MKRITIIVLFLFLGMHFAFAQGKTITGTVTSAADGSTIPGVQVVVKGTSTGVTTDMNGTYSLTVPASAQILQFSFIGMKATEVEIGNLTIINVVMEEDLLLLEEVIVVGYGVQKKREVTGSITQVKGDELAALAAPSFESQLAGRASGVQVTSQSGVLGEAPRIRIRGVGSISSGTYPLIVVDGIPIITGDVGGYASNNAMGDINPSDIESVEILKDGSATAIYGSRAANGVMLITTKHGKKGKLKMSYSTYAGYAQPVNLFDLLHSDDFIMIANEKRSNRGQSALAVDSGLDTDWQSAVLRKNAFQQDHNLSLSGATDESSYYFSLGYSNQQGVSIPNEMSRYSIRANVDQKVKKWLTLGTNFAATQTEYLGMNVGTNSLSGNIFSAIRQLPNTPIYDVNDPTGYNIDDVTPGLVGRWLNVNTIDDNLPNIIYTLKNNRFVSKNNRTTGSAFALANIKPWLTFRTQFGFDRSGSEGLLYYNPFHGDGQSVKGRVQNNYTSITKWNIQNMLSFNKAFNEVHNVSAVLVSEYEKYRVNSFSATGTDLSNEFFQYNLISGSYGTPNSGGSLSENAIISYMARVNYNFSEKYFIQASIRTDGISRLAPGNKWGVFPGGSVGWNIAKESFMEPISNIVSDFKLRASYAQVGNSSIGNYPYAGLYSAAKYGDFNGIAFSQMGNDALQWETSKKTDIGFDAMFYDGRFKLSFDYYMNNQDGLILAAPTPPTFGIPGNSVNKNVGSLKNWGYEFSAEASLINTPDLKWSVEANLTFAKNKVTSLVEGQKEIINAFTIIRVGESINAIYGYDYVGVNMANGNPIYRIADGSMVQGNIPTSSYKVYDPSNPSDISQAASLSSVTDKKIFGSSLPTYFGAITSRLNYKGFDMNVMFRFSGGNYVMNRTRDDLNSQNFTNNGAEILGRWQSEAEPGDGWTPKLWYQGGTFINKTDETSGRFVEKGNFIKLQNVTLGYTFPKTVLNRYGIDNLRVFIQAQDFWMITKYTGIDPEMNGYTDGNGNEIFGVDYNGTPRQRVITMGLNLTL